MKMTIYHNLYQYCSSMCNLGIENVQKKFK